MNQTTSPRTQQPPIWRLPGEYELQSATLLAWPHAQTDWHDRLALIRSEYELFILLILDHQPVLLLKDPRDPDPLPKSLQNQPKLTVLAVSFDDTWARDFGPISQVKDGRLRLLDFKFNAWGKPYANQRDDQVSAQIAKHEETKAVLGEFDLVNVDFVLEGGAIESNGAGSLLINWHCFEKRHPSLDRGQVTQALSKHLGSQEIVGIDLPPHSGDDTDGHIDTFARFLAPDVIAVQTLGDSHKNQTLIDQIHSLTITHPQKGLIKPSVIKLPAINIVSDLPANYVNFLLVNNGCLVPTYGLPSDQIAISLLSEVFPNRQVRGVPCNQMITQFGGLHCASMHFTKPTQIQRP